MTTSNLLPAAPSRTARATPVATVVAVVFLAIAAGPLPHGAQPPVDLAKRPPPKRVVVPKLKGKLTLDGKLEESVWKRAAVLKPFLPNNGEGEEREGTEVRLWYDAEALHIAWICADTDIQATFTQRDSKFWEEEVAEFFVTASGPERYFELQWNPLGGVFDAIIDNDLGPDGVSKKITGHWDYTAAGMKSAVLVKGTVANSADKDTFWQVEVSVPFSDLNQSTPKPGETWRANFYRFNRGKGQSAELLSWSPTQLPGFHQPSRFGFLEFGK
ncbi:MAG: carbohydrate-binding family 9-like protein [Verrucomicrobia bacterium]|nr:carbohydrate-binding family 9-like protein [Verrucomicrobiota bacterium]